MNIYNIYWRIDNDKPMHRKKIEGVWADVAKYIAKNLEGNTKVKWITVSKQGSDKRYRWHREHADKGFILGDKITPSVVTH